MPRLIFLAHDFSLGGKSEPLSELPASPGVQDSAREDHIFLTPSRIVICELPNWRVVSGWQNSSQRAEWNISMDEVSTNYFSDSQEACLQTAGDTSSEDLPSKDVQKLGPTLWDGRKHTNTSIEHCLRKSKQEAPVPGLALKN